MRTGSFSAYVFPSFHIRTIPQGAGQSYSVRRPVKCLTTKSNINDDGEEPPKGPRFDPSSNLDAFGRDPRKETEFWMSTARNVLDSSEVQEAISQLDKNPSDNLTDEQREYLDFIKSLDESAAEREQSDDGGTDNRAS